MRAITFTILLLLLATIGTPHAAVTEVTAVVDKNPITIEESFRLEITANDDVSADAFDSSPLMQDFVVGRTSVSRQTSMVNFDVSKTTKWTTTLIPRQPGQYTIPSLNVAGQTTLPIQISVLPASASKNIANDLFITTEVDLEEAYIQQQIRYTVKLHLAFDLQRGSLSQPEVKDADIRQVGSDKEYTDIINGKRYRIVERVFAIIPNRSGNFVIKGPYFEGEVIDSGRQSFSFFNKTKTVSRVAKNRDIRILPMPEDYPHHWLPSEFVALNEEWQMADDQRIEVGAPITRTITLTAVGVVEEQLPEINSQYTAAFKAYPEQANTTTVQRNGTFVSQRTETVALIANEAGEFVVPEVKVPWFNVTTKNTEYATLPAKTLAISEAQIATANLPVQAETTPEQATPVISPSSPVITPNWWSLSSWILLLLWVSTLVAWWQSSKQRQIPEKKASTSSRSTDSWASLQKALMKKSVAVAEVNGLLEAWLRAHYQQPRASLSSLLRLVNNQELSTLVNEMHKHQYGEAENSAWSAKPLLNQLQSLHKEMRRERSTDDKKLVELYPN